MKVKELIEKLNEYPPDTEVLMASDNFELRGALVKIKGILTETGGFVEEEFMDAFDYEHYTKEVFRHNYSDKKAIRFY